MSKSQAKGQLRPKRLPLTLHKTGQYCKKIAGKTYYFGCDKEKALERYYKQAAYLHLAQGSRASSSHGPALESLCRLYLAHQQARAMAGEIKPRHIYDQRLILKEFVAFVGQARPAEEVTTTQLQAYRHRLIAAGKAANTVNNHLASIKAMYHWAIDNEIIETAPKLRVVRPVRVKRRLKATFTGDQIRRLLERANVKMEAMILLGLNCGFGCTDCSELKWRDLDLDKARVHFARGKTGIDRNLPLWPEIIEALMDVPATGPFVFYTVRGNPWVRIRRRKGPDGVVTYIRIDEVSKQFSKLVKKTGIKTAKGAGFYTLRRTAATLAASSGDAFAVQRLLGHTDLRMASRYIQDISEQTDRAISNSRLVLQSCWAI